MELIKRRVHMNKCNCRNRVQITLSSDFNVPDAKADALSLIKEKGEVELEDACQNDDISVNYTIDDLQTELINSRKIGVKAIVSLELVAEALTDGEGAIDLEADECVMTRKHMIPITQMSICKKDTYRYREEWALPASKLPISKVFYEDITLMNMETRPVEGKINLSGQVKIFLLYMTEEEEAKLDCYENILPISGSVDCNGCDDSMIPQIQIGIHHKDLIIKEDEEGKHRTLDLECIGQSVYRPEGNMPGGS